MAGAATCLGCSARMIAKRGTKTRWHFAHQRDVDCSPETALHRGACLTIERGFSEAKSSGAAYDLRWICNECKNLREGIDCTKFATHTEREYSPVPGVRSDLFFQGEGAFAVEVIVTHQIERETAKRYAAASIPVLEVFAGWNNLARLRTSLFAARTQNITASKCPTCKAAKSWEQKAKRRELDTRRFRALLMKFFQPQGQTGEHTVTVERMPREMRTVGRELLQLGIRQEGLPTAFRLELPEKLGWLFVQIRPPELLVFPNACARLHLSHHGPYWQRKAVSDAFAEWCIGIGIRLQRLYAGAYEILI